MEHGSGGLLGGAMSEAALDRLLTDQGVGVLSLSADGEPYGVPLSFGYDAPDRLYFLFVGHSETGRKVRFAEATSEASFLVVDIRADGGWQSAVVQGSLERITPPEWDAAREAMADNAYRPDLLADFDERSDPRVWRLAVTERSGRSVGVDG